MIILGLLLINTAHSRPAPDYRDPSEFVLRLTTLVDVYFDDGTQSIGSGFFFQVLAPPAPQKSGPQWTAIKETYLMTNRHVLAPEKFNHLQRVVVSLRQVNQSSAEWVPIEISRDELWKRLHLHPNLRVDVTAISVLDLMEKKVKSRTGDATQPTTTNVLAWSAVSRENFPGISRLKIQTTDDLLVVGYPKTIFDHFNRFPILKRATLITPWTDKYEGWDAFLIDSKLYEGSSGGIVISKPTDVLFDNGNWLHSDTKQFLFLGLYSGEPYYTLKQRQTAHGATTVIQKKLIADLGVVWYYSTVEEAIAAPFYQPQR
jgi:hypothetical protein